MTKLVTLIEGKCWTVVATPEVADVLDGVSDKKKIKEIRTLKRLLERFADNPPGPWPFNDEQVKGEGRFRTGKGDAVVQVLAFKAYQSRLYACRDGGGRRLILTGHDLGKKQNKADSGALEAAAKEFGRWVT